LSPGIATLVFALGMIGLFALARDPRSRTSPALWIPLVWLLLAGSRMVSQWQADLSGAGSLSNLTAHPQDYLEGSPIDRDVFTALLLLGTLVLVGRRRKVWNLLHANWPILLFFSYCAISILWSDYPDVAFKRWTKALGDLVMVLLVLTDLDPLAAVKQVFSRLGFLLLPLSILFIKYYPDLGRRYDPGYGLWMPTYTGVTTTKNLLGMITLLCGVVALWGFLQAIRDRETSGKLAPLVPHVLGMITLVAGAEALWRLLQAIWDRETSGKLAPLIVSGAALSMAIWLFWMADSMTALSCFLLAGGMLIALSMPRLARSPVAVHVLVGAALLVSFSTLFLDFGSGLLSTLGRDPTLTGRREIWHLVLGMTSNPWFGTGFESFWLGERLRKMWSIYWWHPNEAHNGYLEVYLNLGWVGVVLLGVVIVTGYRNVLAAFRRNPEAGRLRLAFFVVALTYNFTESGIRTLNPVWIAFLLATLAVPGGWVRRKTKTKTKIENAEILAAFDPQAVDCLEEV
jgi:exopolysaccharide production protein ExoQ